MSFYNLLRIPILLILLILSFSTPCEYTQEQPPEPEAFEEQLTEINELNDSNLPDNETPLAEYNLTEYTLSDLQKFFSHYAPELSNILEIEYQHNDYTPDNVDRRFPMQCLRSVYLRASDDTTITRYYTVYKVKEGGHFYVFWSILDDGTPRIAYSGYLPSIKNIEDFASITEYESCFDDVYAIDPSADFRFGQSNPYSYHLLSTGELLKIEYDYSRLSDTDDLIVVGMAVLPKDNNTGYLAQVYEDDLPKK